MELTSIVLLGQSSLEQTLLMRQLLGDNSPAYLQVTVLLCLFLVIVFKPERIRFPGRMRWSFLLLVASVVGPTLINLIIRFAVSGDYVSSSRTRYGFGMSSTESWLLQLPTLVGLLLLAGSMLMGFTSLWIGTAKLPSANSAKLAQKHPLDD